MPDLSTVVNTFFGADNNKVLYALIILVTLDYITGVCVAIKDKKLSSSIGAKGIISPSSSIANMIYGIISITPL